MANAKKFTKVAMIADMKRVKRQLGGQLTRAQYRALGKYASVTVENKFGSWQSAVKTAR